MKNQNILLVDVGNSAVKWRLLTGSKDADVSEMSHQYYPANINSSFFNDCWRELDYPARIVVSCVAHKEVWQSLAQSCEELWGVKAEKISSEKENFGLINAYKKPAELGSDRWCAMIGACREIQSDLVVVSCGSAITVDVISYEDNQQIANHLGGYILPGLAMMKNSLGTQTAEVNIDTKVSALSLTPASSTTGCVNAAVHLAAVKLIESVVNQQLDKSKKLQCLLAGGDADIVAEFLSIKYIMMPDIVLRGLAYIAENTKEERRN